MKQKLKVHLPSGAIIAALISIIVYLTQGHFEGVSADIDRLAKTQTTVCTRIDRLEVQYSVTIPRMEKNLDEMSSDIKAIRELLYSNIKKGVRPNG